MLSYYLNIYKNYIVTAHLFIHFVINLANWIPTSPVNFLLLIFYCGVTNHHKLEWLEATSFIRSSSEAQKVSMVCLGFLLRLKSKYGLAVSSSGFIVLFHTHCGETQNSVSCVCRTWVHNSLRAVSQGLLPQQRQLPDSLPRGPFHF